MIRTFLPADISSITLIYSHAVRKGTASRAYDPSDKAEMMPGQKAIILTGYPDLVVTEYNPVLGYAYAPAFRSRVGYRASAEDSAHLAPDTQGSWPGKLLLAQRIAH